MAECIWNDHTIIGDYKMPYIVAEVNSSHNGNIATAKKMIDEIKKAGCNCVKFQSWSSKTLYSKTYYKENPIAKRIVEKFALSEVELMELARYCEYCNIDFSSTPYAEKEVDYLVDTCKAPFIKVASMDINNYPFLKYIAHTGKPIVLSTGMADMEEIERAVQTIEQAGNHNICLLHCISLYPPEISTIHLNNIIGLRERFPMYPIGFSDHSNGTELAAAAVALGAAIIEKHFTLDKKKMGMDNQMAIEPVEMHQLVSACHNIFYAMGTKERIVLEAEQIQRKKMRRSIVATKKIASGDIIKLDDLDVKRPGNGLPPEKMQELEGKRALHDIEADTLILLSDIDVEH